MPEPYHYILQPCTILLTQLFDSLGIDSIQEVNSWKECEEKGYRIVSRLNTNCPIQLGPITRFSSSNRLTENVAGQSIPDQAKPEGEGIGNKSQCTGTEEVADYDEDFYLW